MFDITDSEFAQRYIRRYPFLQLDALHQLNIKTVLDLAERLGIKKTRPRRMSESQEAILDSNIAEIRRMAFRLT